VDVTHKRRGRPPLKAEDGPLRGYESTLRHHGASRGSPPTANVLPGQRPSSSRQLRPVTDLSISGRLDPNDPYRKPEISPTFSINAVRSASMSSPGSALPLTSPTSATFPPSWQPFGEFSPARGNTYTYRLDSGPGVSGRSLSDSSTSLPRYGSDRVTAASQSYHYSQRTIYQPSPTFSTADSQPNHQPPLGRSSGLLPPPITVPSSAEFRLPPILPPLTSDGPSQQSASAPQKFSTSAWPSHERHSRSESAGHIDGMRSSHQSQSYSQISPLIPDGHKPTSSVESLAAVLSSSPVRTSTQPSVTFKFPAPSPTELSGQSRETRNEREEDAMGRPAKRRRMELGEMVNE
jgi:hypothetical protein